MLGWLVLAVCSSRILADPVVVVVHLNALKQASWRKRMCGCADIVLCVCHVWHQNPRVCTLHDTLFKTVCKTLYQRANLSTRVCMCVRVSLRECEWMWFPLNLWLCKTQSTEFHRIMPLQYHGSTPIGCMRQVNRVVSTDTLNPQIEFQSTENWHHTSWCEVFRCSLI